MQIRLNREVRLQAGAQGPEGKGRNGWAGWPAGDTLLPYLRVVASARGEVDPETGYLCDIKRLDDLVLRHLLPVIEALQPGGALQATALLSAAWAAMRAEALDRARLEKLRVFLSPFNWLMTHENQPDLVYYSEQFEFSAAHRLHAQALSEADNQAVFGKCNNPRGHGHNYVVEVTVCAPPDPQTGLVVQRAHLAEVVKREVLDPFDHKHLNEDTEIFSRLNPTVEHIARVVHDRLAAALAPLRLARLRVYETPKTWADYGEADSLRLLA